MSYLACSCTRMSESYLACSCTGISESQLLCSCTRRVKSCCKKLVRVIEPPLTWLFNSSLSSVMYRNSWKHKKNDNVVVDNYRPVSLLSYVGKVFEKTVFKYVFNFLRHWCNLLKTNRAYAWRVHCISTESLIAHICRCYLSTIIIVQLFVILVWILIECGIPVCWQNWIRWPSLAVSWCDLRTT